MRRLVEILVETGLNQQQVKKAKEVTFKLVRKGFSIGQIEKSLTYLGDCLDFDQPFEAALTLDGYVQKGIINSSTAYGIASEYRFLEELRNELYDIDRNGGRHLNRKVDNKSYFFGKVHNAVISPKNEKAA